MEMCNTFNKVQVTAAVHEKYLVELEDIYNKIPTDDFIRQFKCCLAIAFNNDHKDVNPFLHRFMDFCIKFILKLSYSKDNKHSDFIDKVIQEILKFLESPRDNIRFQSCDFIQKFLVLSEDYDLLENNYEDLVNILISRLEDIKPQIRTRVAVILGLLQDLDDFKDTIQKALLKSLPDSHGKVRAAITNSFKPTEDIIPVIIGRCRDVDNGVRYAAFKKIATISVQRFTIVQRQFILRNGYKDHSKIVQSYVKTSLLPHWLECYNKNCLQLLKALQLDSNEKDITNTKDLSKNVLNTMFDFMSTQDILDTLYLENKLIPLNKLTWEVAIYWRCLILHFMDHQLDEYSEKIMPEAVIFCDYIDKYCEETRQTNFWEQQLYLLILLELVTILVNCDVSDEATRRRISSFLINTLNNRKLSQDIITKIVKYFEGIMPDVSQRLIFFCDLIADIRTPVEEDNAKEEEDNLKVLKNKLSSLQLKQDSAIRQEEFLLAKKIDQEISDLAKDIEKISIQALEKQERPVQKKSDPETIIKCLDIIYAMLQSPQIDKMFSSLLSLKEELFKEIMLLEDPQIQGKYLICYGIICCLDSKFARENAAFFALPLMLYKTGHKPEIEVLRASVMCITDLLMLYGPNILPRMDPSYENDPSVDFEVLFGNSVATISSTVEALTSMIHDENAELRELSCETLVKLMTNKIVESSATFAQLFVKWWNPATASDVRLRQILGIFINKFCQLPDVEQQIEDAVIPIIKMIFLAPQFSPLASVSKDDVLKCLIRLLDLRNDQEYDIQQNLAIKLCREILADINNRNNLHAHYARTLVWLELRRDKELFIEELLNMCEEIREDISDKVALKYINKLIFSLRFDTLDSE